MIHKNSNYLQGIYFSKITGRIFEATKEKSDSFLLKFTDVDETRTIDNRVFFAQVEYFEFYEILIDYNDPCFR